MIVRSEIDSVVFSPQQTCLASRRFSTSSTCVPCSKTSAFTTWTRQDKRKEHQLCPSSEYYHDTFLFRFWLCVFVVVWVFVLGTTRSSYRWGKFALSLGSRAKDSHFHVCRLIGLNCDCYWAKLCFALYRMFFFSVSSMILCMYCEIR